MSSTHNINYQSTSETVAELARQARLAEQEAEDARLSQAIAQHLGYASLPQETAYQTTMRGIEELSLPFEDPFAEAQQQAALQWQQQAAAVQMAHLQQQQRSLAQRQRAILESQKILQQQIRFQALANDPFKLGEPSASPVSNPVSSGGSLSDFHEAQKEAARSGSVKSPTTLDALRGSLPPVGSEAVASPSSYNARDEHFLPTFTRDLRTALLRDSDPDTESESSTEEFATGRPASLPIAIPGARMFSRNLASANLQSLAKDS